MRTALSRSVCPGCVSLPLASLVLQFHFLYLQRVSSEWKDDNYTNLLHNKDKYAFFTVTFTLIFLDVVKHL